MTQYEYFKQWFDKNCIEEYGTKKIYSKSFQVINWPTQGFDDKFEDVYDIRPLSPNGLTYGEIDEKGLKIQISGYMDMRAWENPNDYFKEYDHIPVEIRAWYDSVMEKWYLNNFLNDNLYTNEEKAKKIKI